MGVKIIGSSGLGFPVVDNSATVIKKGERRWNLKEGSTETALFDDVAITDGADTFKLIRNNSGVTIPKGKVIMASGNIGASSRIIGSRSDGSVTNAVRNIGISKHNIISGSDGAVAMGGKITNMDTTGTSVGESWVDGTILYIKPNGNGELTSIVPTTGQLKMSVAFVIKAHTTQGSMEVRMTGIDENHIRNGLMTGNIEIGTSDTGTLDIKTNGVSKMLFDTYGAKMQGNYLSPFTGAKNFIINGNFDHWQYKDAGLTYPQVSNGYGSDDRWNNGHAGTSTKTHSKVACSDVERALFTASNFSRTVVVSGANNASSVVKVQGIENVALLAGKTVTLSFWAKADSNKNIAIEFAQVFGTGGTPSTTVVGIGSQKVSLTSTWQKKSITVTIPSISGKTIGSDGLHTSYTAFNIWMDAGSNFNSRTGNLGQQSGTFDIAQVQLEEGSVATPFEHMNVASELARCQRYYEIANGELALNGFMNSAGWTANIFTRFQFKVTKRAIPSITVTATATNVIDTRPDIGGFTLNGTANTSGIASRLSSYTAFSEL